MKALTKLFGFSFVAVFVIVIMSLFQDINVRQDELNNVITTAMTSTQTVMKEQIEDKKFETSNKRYAINNNDEYLAEFTKNLYKLKTSDSVYKIYVYGIDYEKGLLDVEVTSSFNMWNGQTKTFTARKTNVIEQIQRD